MTALAPVPPRRPGLLRRTIRNWPGLLIVWLFGSLVALGWIIISIKPAYRASGLLRVDPAANDLFGVRGNMEDIDSFMQTQMKLITSDNVLTAVGTNPKVVTLPRIQAAGDFVQEIRKVIAVGVVPGTYLVEISASSPNNVEAAILVNAVIAAFLDANENWSNGMTRTQIKTLEAYEFDLKEQIAEQERKWKDLVKKGDVDSKLLRDLQDKERLATVGLQTTPGASPALLTIDEYKKIRQDLFQVNLDLAQAAAWLEEVKRAAKDASATTDQAGIDQQVEDRFKVEPTVVELAAKLKEAKQKLEEARKGGSKPGEPAEQAAQKQFDDLTSTYKQAWESRSRIYREQIEEAHRPDLELELREADHRVRFLKVRQAVLSQVSKDLDVTNRLQATDAVEISLIQEDRNTLKSMQEAVHRRLEQLRFESKEGARVREVNKAMVPFKPIADHRLTLLKIVVPIAMLFVAFVPFLLFEAWTGSTGHPISETEMPAEA